MHVWASPFQNPSDMGIPFSYYLSDLGWGGLGLKLKFIQGMPTSLGFWEWGCPKRGDAHITGTPPPFLSPVSSRLIFMFALFPRGSYYLRAWKGTRRIPDPTYYPPTLDTSTFSPQIARQIIQDGGNLVTNAVYNLL